MLTARGPGASDRRGVMPYDTVQESLCSLIPVGRDIANLPKGKPRRTQVVSDDPSATTIVAAIIAGAALFVFCAAHRTTTKLLRVECRVICDTDMLGRTEPDRCLEGGATWRPRRTRYIQPDRARSALYARRTCTDEDTISEGRPDHHCAPPAFPRPAMLGHPVQIVQRPGFPHSFSQRRIRSSESFRQPAGRTIGAVLDRRIWVTRRRGGKATRWWST